MNLKEFLKPSSENLTASGNSAFCKSKRLSNFYYWVKPDWRKIILLVLFLAIFILAFPYNLPIADSYSRVRGLPFPVMFLCKMGLCCNYLCCNDDYSYCKEGWQSIPQTKILFLGSAIDVVFWYLFSCFIVWICDKVKKKEVKQINS